jgi:integrase
MGNEREYYGEGIYKEGDNFRILLYVNGRRYIETTPARTFKQAKLMRAKRLIEVKEGRYFARRKGYEQSFKELMAEFLKYSKATKRSYKRDTLSAFYLLPVFGNCCIAEIVPSMIRNYIAKRLKELTRKDMPPSNSTINRELALLRTVLRRAMDDRLIDRTPKIKLLEENNKRDRVLSPDEYERLLSASAPHIVPIIRLAHDTAMWDRVDFDRKIIILEDEHTKKRPRNVPMSDEMLDMLRKLRAYIGPVYKCVRAGKKYILKPIKGPIPVFTWTPRGEKFRVALGSIKRAFDTARQKAKIPDFRFHDLRHTAITNMRKAGVPDRVIMRISGHKTLKMLDRYDKIDAEDLSKAINQTATYTATNRDIEKGKKPVST